MSHRDRRHAQAAGARHRWLNRLQTALLVLTLALLHKDLKVKTSHIYSNLSDNSGMWSA
ncbi:hypothetical protein [Acinetobacter baumannii]|uniref:hypothetical protein n=1 Tax=Acinetobacter baumannii TaxID=470 RepID=UPI00148F2FC3